MEERSQNPSLASRLAALEEENASLKLQVKVQQLELKTKDRELELKAKEIELRYNVIMAAVEKGYKGEDLEKIREITK
ncbi:hypothetical protein BGZ49_004321 [Haplosporangium sp. Z 27]|nr:hypothetical protein BGZ49_004321 [Haplosporangium sp. Z 27]